MSQTRDLWLADFAKLAPRATVEPATIGRMRTVRVISRSGKRRGFSIYSPADIAAAWANKATS